MPYIRQVDRKEFFGILTKIYNKISKIKDKQERVGLLSYLITSILTDCIEPRKYSDYTLLFGLLETIKHEIYRKMLAPYEDKKREENGDLIWDWWELSSKLGQDQQDSQEK